MGIYPKRQESTQSVRTSDTMHYLWVSRENRSSEMWKRYLAPKKGWDKSQERPQAEWLQASANEWSRGQGVSPGGKSTDEH